MTAAVEHLRATTGASRIFTMGFCMGGRLAFLTDGIELASICSYEGKSFSEGAVACMAERRMTCAATGRWVPDGGC